MKLACGTDHTAALTSGGDVYTWGYHEFGQLGRKVLDTHLSKMALVPTKVAHAAPGVPGRNVVDVGAGSYSTYVVAADGKVYCTGLNNFG